ncbi:helix-turn-helix domain-containing protein [Rhizobium leguminosarum bv. viciae]|uniref:Helix-turn-helix domain-containing protein n=1 Tax=Rhizobium leguminosarum bv. viciae TaxID=387 RepID=A0A7G6RJH7_RHILV|nr:helix-turn-helix domain-containing protein [Rhizobium leguminosarum bv. viciae]
MGQKQPPPGLSFFKALTIAPLSSDAKAVGGALFDHFNTKTGQCDPSLRSLAQRLCIARRTIIDAIDELEHFGLLQGSGTVAMVIVRHISRTSRRPNSWSRTSKGAARAVSRPQKHRSCTQKTDRQNAPGAAKLVATLPPLSGGKVVATVPPPPMAPSPPPPVALSPR